MDENSKKIRDAEINQSIIELLQSIEIDFEGFYNAKKFGKNKNFRELVKRFDMVIDG